MRQNLKAVILFFLVFLAACADTSRSIGSEKSLTVKVAGVGVTQEDAKRAGFRDAIQEAYGSLTLSERRISNDKLFEDDVSYAKGVIVNYQVLSSEIDLKDNLYRVVMFVSVSTTSIQRRLLDTQESRSVDGGVLSNKIAVGIAQVNSEIDRYLNARRLFEHITRDLGRSIFDVKSGEIQTIRDGREISTYIEVIVSVNDESLKNLCAAAKEYHETRVSSVSQDYKNDLNLLRICNSNFEIESGHFQSMIKSLREIGFCLHFNDGVGITFLKQFYVSKIVDDGVVWSGHSIPSYAKGWTTAGGLGWGVYGPREIGVSTYNRDNMTGNAYPNVIRIVRKVWGNDISFKLKIPQFQKYNISRLNEVKAIITNEATCG
jgi:hypothetical protein